jgi:hypothetical protein
MLKWPFARKQESEHRQTEVFNVRDIHFLREQDGVPERELKVLLSKTFKENIRITAAYLVRLRYAGSQEETIALCLKADACENAERLCLVERVNVDFSRIFAQGESLDTIFLSPKREQAVSQIAKPFYRQAQHKA